MPVVASFTAVPSAGPAPLEVTFTDTSTLDENAIVTWEWYSDAGEVTPFSTEPGPVTFTYTEDGTYHPWLRVDDNEGFDVSDPGTVTVGDVGCTGVVADFTFSPESGAAPLEVQFTDASVACENPVDFWYWRFRYPSTNPAHTSNAQFPSHTYAAPGLYTVVLQVSAGTEGAERVRTVLVLDGGDGPPESALFLAVGGHEEDDGGLDLFVDGADPEPIQRTMPLYTSGFPGQTALLTLATGGQDDLQGGVEFVAFGGLGSESGLPLVTVSNVTDEDGLAFSLTGSAVPAGEASVSFALHATTEPGWCGGVDLVLAGDVGTLDAGVNLVAAGEASDDLSASLNLTAFGGYLTTDAAVPLLAGGATAGCPVTWEAWTEGWEDAVGVWGCDPAIYETGEVTLFLAGSPVGLDESGMNLFIDRPEAAMVPFVLHGPAFVQQESVTMVVAGADLAGEGVDLSLPEVVDDQVQGVRLYVRGW